MVENNKARIDINIFCAIKYLNSSAVAAYVIIAFVNGNIV